MKRTFRIIALLLVTAAIALIAGCDRETYIGTWETAGRIGQAGQPGEMTITFNEDDTAEITKDGVTSEGTWGQAEDASTNEWKSVEAKFDGESLIFRSLGKNKLECDGQIFRKKEDIVGEWRSVKILYNDEEYDETRLLDEDKMIYMTFKTDGSLNVEGGGRSTDEASYELNGKKVTFISVSGVNKVEGIYDGDTIEFKQFGGMNMDITLERVE